MICLRRRRMLSLFLALFFVLTIWRAWVPAKPAKPATQKPVTEKPVTEKPVTDKARYEPEKDYFWRIISHNYPVSTFRPMPTAAAAAHALPPVQADSFPAENAAQKEVRLARQKDIRDSFVKSWKAYKKHAWLRDEVAPVSGGAKDSFGGWGATLIDSLDTLWIMGLRDDFDEAVSDVAEHAVFLFTKEREINVSETAMRFLGGLLSAYDLSGDQRLLAKAHNVGDMLYKAFDTPNHLPVTRWNPHEAARGTRQAAASEALLAEVGSLTLEFTRLSLVTGDARYHDAVQHISELLAASQDKSKLRGMWPAVVDPAKANFDAGATYTLGAMADSAYEYLPKMMALLGQPTGIYRDMYAKSVAAARDFLFFRPMTPDGDDVLLTGFVTVDPDDASGRKHLSPASGHAACFTGGMLALGGRLTRSTDDVSRGQRLTDGCVWAYKSFRRGVMPETFYLTPCPNAAAAACPWAPELWHQEVLKAHSATTKKAQQQQQWQWQQQQQQQEQQQQQQRQQQQQQHWTTKGGPPLSAAESIIQRENLPPSFSTIGDARYALGPEAIESIFVMYRVTGDRKWQDKAWDMWRAIDTLTSTKLAYSAVADVNPPAGEAPRPTDSMESFWLAATLKYFYLVFAEPDLLSLDDWVFNTEAHPFKRLKG